MAGRWQAHEPQPITHRQNITTLQVRQFNDRLATIARALAKARVVDLSDAHAAIERGSPPSHSCHLRWRSTCRSIQFRWNGI